METPRAQAAQKQPIEKGQYLEDDDIDNIGIGYQIGTFIITAHYSCHAQLVTASMMLIMTVMIQ